MGINLSVPATKELKPRILVFGVGGAGGNAVNNMINSALEGVEFVVANTDAQALTNSLCERRIQLGVGLTQGLGAGARPDVGRAAAEEAIDQILDHMQGSHMCFITAGMGGGTGTGAGPVIARAARELGILTVGVVTKPFQFEGSRRMSMAEAGIEELQQYVDTLIIIPNQNLFRVANEKTTFAEAFKMADNVLHQGVRGVTDLMVMPGLINLDFADVRTVMSEMGKAMMGTGEADGQNRAIEAAERAIANPLLDDVSMKGAKGVLINITGGMDLTLYEVDEAANRIRSEVDPDANIIVGSTFNETMEGRMRVSVVATGIEAMMQAQGRPNTNVTQFRPSVKPQAVAPMAPPLMGGPAVAVQAVAVQQAQPQSQPGFAPAGLQAAEVSMAAEAARAPMPSQQPELAVETRQAPRGEVRATQVQPQPSFIPPAPVEPQTRREPQRAHAAAPAPRAETQGEAAPARRPSLFDRVMRTARNTVAPGSMTPGPAEPVRHEPQAQAPAAQPAEPRPQTPRSAGLSVDPADRPVQRTEEDLLEIPAFLRRQAN
ncbi:MAG: cell division protein FtsZ [Alphaproteobacteria bacterium]|nr:cell division protein FtsZ [Alphaproteobacteria bacterium]